MKIALQIIEEAKSPFQPASKEEVKSRGPKPRMADLEVQEAIEKVVDYLWADEVRGFEEDSDKEYEEGDPIDKNHILYSLAILQKFVEGR